MVKKQRKIGICKLTGHSGPYVKSHIIPAALTKPEKSGFPFIQGGSGLKAEIRWSSWYDDGLVTRKGEDILAQYDDWAIAELRRLGLVWSGWKADQSALNDHTQIPETPWGIRKVVTRDTAKLRLFFLSLLWRAASTERWEFGEIYLPADHLEQLRVMVLNGNPEPISFYPISLTQLSTKGDIQNQTPFAGEKPVYPGSESEPIMIPFFRFYMDGLIAHIGRQVSDHGQTKELGSQVVGSGPEVVLSTVTYEESFQRKNLRIVMAETMFRPAR